MTPTNKKKLSFRAFQLTVLGGLVLLITSIIVGIDFIIIDWLYGTRFTPFTEGQAITLPFITYAYLLFSQKFIKATILAVSDTNTNTHRSSP